MEAIPKEEEKNNPINNEEYNNSKKSANNKSNSLSESLSNSNSFNEENDNIAKLKNQLNFLIETLNYEQAIILCKKILFFTPQDPYLYKTLSDLYLKIFDISSSITRFTRWTIIRET